MKGIEPSSSAWKAVALPLSYTRESPCEDWWERQDSNLRRRKPADLQSAPFATRDTLPNRRTALISKDKRGKPQYGEQVRRNAGLYGHRGIRSQGRRTVVEHLSGSLKALAGLQEMAPAGIEARTIRRTAAAQRTKAERIKAHA